MNIIANAIDILDESNTGLKLEKKKGNYNKILIRTSMKNNYLKISITDNLQGMSVEVKSIIFHN